jgi:hypothetical protein
MEFDISITGAGFFTIRAHNDRAVLWMDEFIDGTEEGVAFCDDVRLVTEIAEGAMEEGFVVSVNGHEYLGGNRAAA